MRLSHDPTRFCTQTHIKYDFALQVPTGITKMVTGQRPDRRGAENTRNPGQDQRDRAPRFVQTEAEGTAIQSVFLNHTPIGDLYTIKYL